ncbi:MULTISPECIES: stage II sporulation protein D [unclassified Clostridium]|uniref:stage II sporulation protein D n=1 Tax=Clostridium TaxID=1485 RepID=UPI001C8B45B1|nr:MULTISPECIES: stage II sporulation protein D [unclassified Clostridium]MBX9138154.1 stage II sporulation protein D [Clostridium sp. K12(2020)]MBX9142926.1 stage II sporulation protein D [Clostridium sp. K13]MDU2290115.1 stage II sporulation protein D [Clostridium celatum]MDU4323923.1 stage II sporulation protein D [Clostridium celatum]
MKKINCGGISKIKLILYTTILIILFMIIIPMLSIKTTNIKDNKQPIKNEDTTKETLAEISNEIYIDGDDTVRVYRTLKETVEEINIEDYICGVVANEMQVNFEEEALKAQAIASRTYLASRKMNNCSIHNGTDICDSMHCQVYSSKDELINKWGEENGEKYWNKIQAAVEATKGMILTYNGELVLYPLFFSTSSGNTESASDLSFGDIPYLISVESLGEESSPKFTSTKEMTLSDLSLAINAKYPNSGVNIENLSSKLQIGKRSDAGGVVTVVIGNDKIDGAEFRAIAGLNSTNFTYSIKDKTIIFECKGYGHGVGMSQWGANIMAKEGNGYEEILKHYYTGINIGYLKFS